MARINNKAKKKNRKPYKNIGDLYTEAVAGKPRINLQAIREFIKEGEEYEVIVGNKKNPQDVQGFDVTKQAADQVKKIAKLGSTQNTSVRQEIETRLQSLKGAINDNLNVYQTFISNLGIQLTQENANKFAHNLKSLVHSNSLSTFSELLGNSYNISPQEIAASPEFISVVRSESTPPTLHARVGSGELFLTFFSNGSKPHVGDVLIGGDFKIEVKHTDGLLLKGGTPPTAQEYQNSLIAIYSEYKINNDTNKFIEELTHLATSMSSANTPSIVSQIKQIFTDKVNELTKVIDGPIFRRTIFVAQLLRYKEITDFQGLVVFNAVESSNVKAAFLNTPAGVTIQQLYDATLNLGINYALQFGSGGAAGHKIKFGVRPKL